ncbi:MAG: tRNA (adenosine(37)-N6)-threonylcarbamoyltransferase complex ATPase subunit type 1 TsaE [Eubacteriales bacterium]|nr:tRNA (adenosine(37)-N6)-threonylcarbamoyltransferase complex ATPase subunit type 1 TsaE [Eubacteriales bacterium]
MKEKLIQVNSPLETAALGAYLAGVIEAPAIILLSGDLGAGKTHFAQGFARGLGISEAITSPSFSLLNRYRSAAGPELLHFDVYRLEDPYTEWEMLGFSELIEGQDIALIEWPERIAEILPETAYALKIHYPRELNLDLPLDSRLIELDQRLAQPSAEALAAAKAKLEE